MWLLLLTFIVIISDYSDDYDFFNCTNKWIAVWKNIIDINFYIDNPAPEKFIVHEKWIKLAFFVKSFY